MASPGWARSAEILTPARNDADAGGGDEDLVALAAVDDLGVAGDELDAGFGGSGAHGLDDAAEIVDRQAFFEDERGGEIERLRAAHREVVDGAVDGETADVAAGKEDRRDDKGVGGEGEARVADGEHGLIVELVEHGIAEGGQKDFVDEVGGELAAAAMAEHDLLVLVDRDGAGAEQRRDGGLRLRCCFSLVGVFGWSPWLTLVLR